MDLIRVRYPDHREWRIVYDWLEENCEQSSFYTGIDWQNWETGKHNRMVEFKNEKDATMFALRFA